MQMKMLAMGNQLSSGESDKFVLETAMTFVSYPSRQLGSNL